jgi:predicted phosphodiesterase
MLKGRCRIAVVADVHSNLAALDAGLSDVAERNWDMIVNLGDIVSGLLSPS